MPQTRIGISGWRYAPWRSVFYPNRLPQKDELAFASRQFNTVEINGSFYSLQRPTSYRQWYDATPDDFVFAVKGGRFITHMKKLNDVDDALANFFASGPLALKEKLGPILWQFPPNFGFDESRFQRFFQQLPYTFGDASKLAKQHTEKLKGRSHTRSDDPTRRIRHAVEIRHPTFCDPRFVALLRQHNIAAVFADTAGRWPYFEDLTADFVYCRLHGATELYVSGYTDTALKWWADRVAQWRSGQEPQDTTRLGPPAPKRKSRDVYIYFDNDAKVRAPFDAIALTKLTGVSPKRTPTAVDPQREAGEAARETWPVAARNAPRKR